MKRERLFEAIGAVAPTLVEHSERPGSLRKWVKWSGLCAACLILGALGIANMWIAIFADVGVMVIAVLNAIRCLKVEGR